MTTQQRHHHPVTALRVALGFSRLAFAQKLGLPYSSVANLELGYPKEVPKRVTVALRAELGVDISVFEAQYQLWRSQAGRGLD